MDSSFDKYSQVVHTFAQPGERRAQGLFCRPHRSSGRTGNFNGLLQRREQKVGRNEKNENNVILTWISWINKRCVEIKRTLNSLIRHLTIRFSHPHTAFYCKRLSSWLRCTSRRVPWTPPKPIISHVYCAEIGNGDVSILPIYLPIYISWFIYQSIYPSVHVSINVYNTNMEWWNQMSNGTAPVLLLHLLLPGCYQCEWIGCLTWAWKCGAAVSKMSNVQNFPEQDNAKWRKMSDD